MIFNLFPPNTILDNIILVVSKIPPNLYKFKNIANISVPMSWEKESTCYILRK